MEVMSYTYYLCLVIIVLSHYVSSLSTQTQQEDSIENSIFANLVGKVSSTEDKVLSEGEGDENSPAEDNAKTPATFTWPSAAVPYVIGKEYDPIIAQRIRSAMHTIESSSCVVFKDMQQPPPPGQHSSITWLSIENPEGVRECSHTTMREDGVDSVTKAILVIGYDCMMRRDILHALLHALGFMDEVTHPQRDLYIRVMWSNIQPKYRKLFWMRMGQPPHKMVEYDSMSVMHFHDRAFSVNGGATIMPLVSGLIISPSDTLSQIDVMKLRLAFGHECKKRKVFNLLQTCHNALKDDDEEQTDPENPTDPEDPTYPEDPTDPEDHTDPEDPTNPEDPIDSEDPTDPEDPTNPEDPTDPEDLTNPEDPTDPEDPTNPEDPTDPEDPTNPEDPTYPEDPTNSEDPDD